MTFEPNEFHSAVVFFGESDFGHKKVKVEQLPNNLISIRISTVNVKVEGGLK